MLNTCSLHGQYLVVWETQSQTGLNCPVCDLENELEALNCEIEDMNDES